MKPLKLILGLESSHACCFPGLFSTTTSLRTSAVYRPRQVFLNAGRCIPLSKVERLHTLPHASWLMQASSSCHHAEFASATKTETVDQASVRSHMQPTSHLKLLTEYFGISKSSVYKMMNRDNRLKSCDVHTLTRNINILMENGLDSTDVQSHIPLLYRCPLTTEHHISVLRELGLKNLTAEHYIQFKALFKHKVLLLKRWGHLPEQYDPLETTLAPLGVPDQVLNTFRLPDTVDHLTLAQLHRELSLVYLSWRLDCDREDISKLHQTYRLTKKSMRLQQQVIHQLCHQWDINISKILQNGYLLTCSPPNLDLIKSKVNQIGGVDIKYFAIATPRILTLPYHQLLQVNSILTRLKVSQSAVKSVPRICTLHPDTLEERIADLQKIPEYLALQSHPRMLRLICYHKKITSRLDLLQQVKKTHALPSLNTLSGTRSIFHKYVTVGDLRQTKRDVITCLANHLQMKPGAIRKCLHLRCWGSQTTVVNVRKNLITLIEAGYTTEQLRMGLDAVLYPPELLQDQLAVLPNRPQAQPFSEFKSHPHVLQLLLYYMEKNASITISRV